MLFKKLLRTLKLYKTQFISMIIMITLGVGVFVGFNMEWYSIETDLKTSLEASGFADYRIIDYSGFSEESLQKVAEINGVDDATLFVSVNTLVKDGKGKDDTLALTVTTNENVSGVALISGAAYDKTSEDGLWLSDKYAIANGYSIGDTITLSYKSLEFTGTVKGLVKSSEYLICVPDETQLMPDFNSYGFVYVSPVVYKTATAGLGIYSQINVLSSLSVKQFTEAVNAALEKTNMIVPKTNTLSYSEAMGESEEGKTMGSILPVLFLAIASLTMITTMRRITSNEKIQIGILKALGFKNDKIAFYYTSFALTIGILGSILGIGLGYGIAYFIMNPTGAMGTYLDFLKWDLVMPWFCMLIVILMICILSVIALLSVRRILTGSSAEVLRPYAPKKVKSLVLEKTGVWKKLPFGVRWNLRDAMRHKSRTFMTWFGVFGCVVLILGGLGMQDTLNKFVDVFYNGATNYETVINIADEATNNDALSIAELYDGDWAAKSTVSFNDKPVSLEIYHIENNTVRFINEDMNFIKLNDEGAYVCSRLAKEFGIKVGDSVSFSPYGTNEVFTVKISSVVRSLSEGIILSDAYTESLEIPYKINAVYTKNIDVAKSPFIVNTQSKSSVIKSFDTFISLMKTMVVLLIVMAIILGVTVLYNLGVMSYTERYREMATLKVVGFKNKKISRLLIEQNLVITLLGILIGIPAGFAVLAYLIAALAAEYEMKLYVSFLSVALTVILTTAVSLFVSFLLSKKNKKINMVEALKSGE